MMQCYDCGMARGKMTRTKAWLCIVICTVMLAVSLISAARHVVTLSYSTTTGQVVAQSIEPRHGKGTTYIPVVRYSYMVNGTNYENDDVFVDRPGATKAWASGVINQFPAGSQCTVYYNASSPNQSVLRRWPGGPSLFLMIAVPALAGVFLAVCVTWLVRNHRFTSRD